MNTQAVVRNFVFVVLGLFLFKIAFGDSMIHHRKPASKNQSVDMRVSE